MFLSSQVLISEEYISIKKVTNKANLRKGPGDWYPIKWIIETPNLPLKVIERGDVYNKVELHDGTQGWLSKILTSEKINLIVIKNTSLVDKRGNVKAKVMNDQIIKEHDCNLEKRPKLCKVKIQNLKGYIKKNHLWGYTHSIEVIN